MVSVAAAGVVVAARVEVAAVVVATMALVLVGPPTTQRFSGKRNQRTDSPSYRDARTHLK